MLHLVLQIPDVQQNLLHVLGELAPGHAFQLVDALGVHVDPEDVEILEVDQEPLAVLGSE